MDNAGYYKLSINKVDGTVTLKLSYNGYVKEVTRTDINKDISRVFWNVNLNINDPAPTSNAPDATAQATIGPDQATATPEATGIATDINSPTIAATDGSSSNTVQPEKPAATKTPGFEISCGLLGITLISLLALRKKE
jgi:hypothetical protein